MRDANNRPVSNLTASKSGHENIPNPASYTIPASALNTFTVDFASSKSQICSTQAYPLLKTQATTPNVLDNEHKLLPCNTSGDDRKKNAFICNIHRMTPEPSKITLTGCSSPCSFTSDCTCSKVEATKEVPLKMGVEVEPVQQQNSTYQNNNRKLKGSDVSNKPLREPRTNILSSIVSTINSSVFNHHNIDKVNLGEFFCTTFSHIHTPNRISFFAFASLSIR